MKRKQKLILIIFICAIVTYLIYFFNKCEKVSLVALGDGIASGETAYSIDGISYNDYIKEYFSGKKLLKNYNNKYANKMYKLNDLILDIQNVNVNKKNLNIQQIIHKASLITIAIGEDELTSVAKSKDLDKEYIDKYLSSFAKLMGLIKEISEAKIIIVGYYENKYLDKTSVIILNSEIANIAKRYEAIFINISDLFYKEDYFLTSNSYYFNYKGHLEIANMIIHSI